MLVSMGGVTKTQKNKIKAAAKCTRCKRLESTNRTLEKKLSVVGQAMQIVAVDGIRNVKELVDRFRKEQIQNTKAQQRNSYLLHRVRELEEKMDRPKMSDYLTDEEKETLRGISEKAKERMSENE